MPQNANLKLGDWKKMENVWDRAIKEGRDVAVDIRPVYAGDGARPTRFVVEYTVDGVSSLRRFPTLQEVHDHDGIVPARRRSTGLLHR